VSTQPVQTSEKATATSADHLKKSARDALNWNAEKRIEFVNTERWIGYDRALEVLKILEDLSTRPKMHRMPCLLLVADTNNGKTMILNRFLSKHQAQDNVEGDAIIVPVLIVHAPPAPDEGRFYDEILRMLNAPFRESDRASKKQFQVIALLQRIGLRLLIIDEIHDILAGGHVHQRNFRNAIKQLTNKLRIPIVGAGTNEAFNAIHTDPQLANRFKPIRLPKWRIDDSKKSEEDPFLQLLSSFEHMLPLQKPSRLTHPSIALQLQSMSEGLIGEIAEILRLATIAAIKSKTEQITLSLLSNLKWVPPNQRKWTWEATPQVGNPGNGNASK
jgi:hypothetical protein